MPWRLSLHITVYSLLALTSWSHDDLQWRSAQPPSANEQDVAAGCGPGELVEVAVASDPNTVHVIGPLITSAVLSSRRPRCLRFHVLAPEAQAAQIAGALGSTLAFHRLVDPEAAPSRLPGARPTSPAFLWRLSGGTAVRLVPFDTSILDRSIKVVGSGSQSAPVCSGLEGCDPARAKRLRKTTNFARFFLGDILPEIAKVIWVDCDVVVRQDLQVLWQRAFAEGSVGQEVFLAAFAEPAPVDRFYFSREAVSSFWKERHGADFDFSSASFNDGAIVIDLRKWRELRVSEEVEWWMHQHQAADPGLWKFGTQPIMILVGAKHWHELPPEWYLGDLGFQPLREGRDGLLKQAVVMHFDGEHKPWLPVTVSDVNARHGVRASWNEDLLRPYFPMAASLGWLAAPGAHCLSEVSTPATPAPCLVGPLVPGVTVPGLQWWPTASKPQSLRADPQEPRRDDLLSMESPLADSLVAGFFSAGPLKKGAGSVMEPCLFASSAAGAVIEILFKRPQRLVGAYLQAASPEHPVSGAKLEYRWNKRKGGGWHSACSQRQTVRCDPHRAPGLSAGDTESCWQVAVCKGVRAMHWRVAGLTVQNAEQLLGGLWLKVAAREEVSENSA